MRTQQQQQQQQLGRVVTGWMQKRSAQQFNQPTAEVSGST
jgi:hypothetical protein